MKDHVTDFETSKRLEAVGVREPSKFVWLKSLRGEYIVMTSDVLTPFALRRRNHDYDPHPAYLLTELLAMVEGDWNSLEWFKGWEDGAYWFSLDKNELPFKSDNPIQAVSEAIIWQRHP